MNIKKVLIHRYDNKPDIEEAKKRNYSNVYKRSQDNHDILVVIPTTAAKTEYAIFGKVTTQQHVPSGKEEPWPGRPDVYGVHVGMENVQDTTKAKVRDAIESAGNSWLGAWSVRTLDLDIDLLK